MSDGRKSLFKMGKLGILWQLDRTNGHFMRATDLGYQTIVQMDPETGKVTYLPGKIPQIGEEVDMCPSTAGFKDWRAIAYSPQTNAFYIPMNLNCEKAIFGAVEKVIGGGGVGPVQRKDYKFPNSGGSLGEFLAMDIEREKCCGGIARLRRQTRRALTTAGRRSFLEATGIAMCTPMTRRAGKFCGRLGYQPPHRDSRFRILAKGKQYIAVPAGVGGGSWSTLIPPELAPEIHRPNSGNAIFVFAVR